MATERTVVTDNSEATGVDERVVPITNSGVTATDQERIERGEQLNMNEVAQKQAQQSKAQSDAQIGKSAKQK